MDIFKSITLVNLLNDEGKRLLISNVTNILDIIVSIIFFGNPSKVYIKELLAIYAEFSECILINENCLLPRAKRSKDLLNLTVKFNKIQQDEEIRVLELLRQVNATDINPKDSLVNETNSKPASGTASIPKI